MNLLNSIRHLEARLIVADDLHGWFKSLSKKQQQDYLRLHPNSELAAGGAAPKPAKKPTPGTQSAWKRKLYDIKGESPGDKDHQRMKDIVTKGGGDHDKMMRLVNQMANSIKDADKARRRGDAAYHNLPSEIAEEARNVFHQRARDLG